MSLHTSVAVTSAAPGEIVRSLLDNRALVLELARREVAGRYRGSVLGMAWSFVNPLLMLAVYTFLFGTVFRMRWGAGDAQDGPGYALTLFAGLVVHGLFAECLNRAPGVVLANPSYVKRVVFPLEIMGWVTVLSALFHVAVSTGLLLAGLLIVQGTLPPTVLWIPVVVAPLAVACTGLVWWLSAAGVYLRDLGQATGVIASVALFLAPVLYPMSAIPGRFRGWIALNPITFPVEQFRAVTIDGVQPDFGGLAIYALAAAAFAWAGFWWFQRARRGFADVL